MTDSLLDQMLDCGADLISEDGENPEYDRAISEFIVDMSGEGLNMDDKDTVLAAMRARKALRRG